jgi:hypothetical protein
MAIAQDVKNSSYATDFMLGNSECVYGCFGYNRPSVRDTLHEDLHGFLLALGS